MKPSSLKTNMKKRIQANIMRPLHIKSSPGLGKTQITQQVAKELEIGCITIHAPLLQPEDYGFPVINQAKTDVDFIVSTHKFPLEASSCPETGILLIDELSQADNSAQKILANLFQEREIHGKKLKPGWKIVSTGNRTTDRAGANRILTHLADRYTEVELELSLDDWSLWALDNQVPPELISFIRFKPDLLSNFDPNVEKNPTPRSWVEGVGKALGLVTPEDEFEVFKGDVGEGAAAEFLGFLKLARSLPNPDSILLQPDKANIPEEPALLYALCGAMTHRTSPDNFGRVMQFISRMPPEFCVLYVRDAIKKCPEVQNTKDFITWATKQGASILI